MTHSFQAAGKATILEPPNIEGMETTCNGVPLVCPRGWGTHPLKLAPAQSGTKLATSLAASAVVLMAASKSQ